MSETDLTTVETTDEARGLAALTMEEVAEMNVADLKALCLAEALPVGGKRAELIKRLRTKKLGVSNRYAGSLTKCAVCGAAANVKGTRTETMKDGRVLVTRNMQCMGKHRHRYPLKEVVEPQK